MKNFVRCCVNNLNLPAGGVFIVVFELSLKIQLNDIFLTTIRLSQRGQKSIFFTVPWSALPYLACTVRPCRGRQELTPRLLRPAGLVVMQSVLGAASSHRKVFISNKIKASLTIPRSSTHTLYAFPYLSSINSTISSSVVTSRVSSYAALQCLEDRPFSPSSSSFRSSYAARLRPIWQKNCVILLTYYLS
jgi:hypothetical protein